MVWNTCRGFKKASSSKVCPSPHLVSLRPSLAHVCQLFVSGELSYSWHVLDFSSSPPPPPVLPPDLSSAWPSFVQRGSSSHQLAEPGIYTSPEHGGEQQHDFCMAKINSALFANTESHKYHAVDVKHFFSTFTIAIMNTHQPPFGPLFHLYSEQKCFYCLALWMGSVVSPSSSCLNKMEQRTHNKTEIIIFYSFVAQFSRSVTLPTIPCLCDLATPSVSETAVLPEETSGPSDKNIMLQ